MERLTLVLNMTEEDRALASAIAICHDVGRFPQYRDYRTFNDAVSINHAASGVDILRAAGVVQALDPRCRHLLLQSVALHNVFALPSGLDPLATRYAQLIRDADKLDIWRIFVEYFRTPPEERASAVTWELPETGTCSDGALGEVATGRLLPRHLLQTVDDFKLLQLSWVFDLNFRESFVLLAEHGYIEQLVALLPKQGGCPDAVARVRSHVAARLAGSASD